MRAVFDGPILAKDFVVDPRQVAEARIAGADAVLAMLSVLDDAEARAVIAEARALGMDVLVEAHDEAEVRRAVALGAPLIGINNRDLKTLEVDLATTERLAAAGARRPAGRRRIRDRGPRRRRAARASCRRLPGRLVADARRRRRRGRRGRSPSAGSRSAALTNAEDAALAARAGATYVGHRHGAGHAARGDRWRRPKPSPMPPRAPRASACSATRS